MIEPMKRGMHGGAQHGIRTILLLLMRLMFIGVGWEKTIMCLLCLIIHCYHHPALKLWMHRVGEKLLAFQCDAILRHTTHQRVLVLASPGYTLYPVSSGLKQCVVIDSLPGEASYVQVSSYEEQVHHLHLRGNGQDGVWAVGAGLRSGVVPWPCWTALYTTNIERGC